MENTNKRDPNIPKPTYILGHIVCFNLNDNECFMGVITGAFLKVKKDGSSEWIYYVQYNKLIDGNPSLEFVAVKIEDINDTFPPS